MLTLLSRTSLRRGAGLVLPLGFVVVACSERTDPTSPSPPMAQAIRQGTQNTATLSNVLFGACNNLTLGYALDGVEHDLETFTGGCGAAPGSDHTINYRSNQTLLLFLRDNTCGYTFYENGPHGTVVPTGPNSDEVAISDAGGFCESPPDEPRPGANVSLTRTITSGMNVCDVEGLWAALAFGGGTRSNGEVNFDIFNQVPPAPEDDDGSESFALATQLALGLGNAGEGDKYHFRFQTVLVTNGATARGHGFLFVPSSGMAAFVIAGKGTHPMGGGDVPPTPGSFKVSGSGNVQCVNGEGTSAFANNVHVEYEDGTTEEPSVTMAHCPPDGPCEPPLP
jgi:hypothetical protein